jgi:tRNA1Val (adenine37-N6)-methyltransferase
MAVFAFKDFVVRQDNSPLKVNTDAILLGAAIPFIPDQASVLEVGTGNGVIALLLALRFPTASITGIDPHLGAFSDAQLNFQHSAFFERLHARNCSLAELSGTEKYNIIVSNPPYFIDSLMAEKLDGQQAKHISAEAYFELLAQMQAKLTTEGQLWLILPPKVASQTIDFFAMKGFYCTQKLRFHANPSKPDKRWMLCFEGQESKCKVREFCIRNADGTYHADYRQLAGSYHDRPI